MSLIVADRVRETTTTTGTGPLLLGGAAAGYRTFASAMSVGSQFYYTVAARTDPYQWEVGIGTLTAPTTLTRTSVISSSAGLVAVNLAAGLKDVYVAKPAESEALIDPSTCNGRLSAQSMTPFPDHSIAGATTLYFVPIAGCRMALWDGLRWRLYTFATELSLAVAAPPARKTKTGNIQLGYYQVLNMSDVTGLYAGMVLAQTTGIPADCVIASIDTASQITLSKQATATLTGTTLQFTDPNCDVFAFASGSTIAMELVSWSDNNNRFAALALQDGVLVSNNDKTRRYLGTVRLVGSNSIDDTPLRRFLYSYYTPGSRASGRIAVSPHQYTIGAWRVWNGSLAAVSCEFVLGAPQLVSATTRVLNTGTTGSVNVAMGHNTVQGPGGINGWQVNTIGDASPADIYQALAGYNYLAPIQFGAQPSATYDRVSYIVQTYG